MMFEAKQSQAGFSSIPAEVFFHHHPCIMLFFESGTGAILAANQAASAFYQYSQERFKGLTLADLRAAMPAGYAPAAETSAAGAVPVVLALHRRADQTQCLMEESLVEGLGQGGTWNLLSLRDHTPAMEARMCREVIELAADAILLGDAQGRITKANARMLDLCGRTAEGLVGRHISELFDASGDRHAPMRHDWLRQGKCVILERNLLRPDGTSVVVEMSSRLMPDSTYQSIFRDVTLRRRSEEALRLSEEKFAKAFKTSPDSVNINRLADGMYLDINDGFTAMTGYTREEVIGKSSLPGELGIWVHREDRDRMVAALRAHGIVRELEAEFRCKDGHILYGSMSARILEIGGEPCILSITRDLSLRKQQEDALRESEERFRSLFNSLIDGMVVMDIEQRQMVVGNEKFAQMLGYAPEEIPNLCFGDLHPAQDLGWVGKRLEEQIQGQMMIVTDIPVKRKDGSVFECDVAPSLMTLSGRRCIMGSFRDVTYRKQTEKLIRDRERNYREIFNSTGDALIIHDDRGNVVDVNGRMCALFKVDYTTALTLSMDAMCLGVSPYSRKEVLEYLHKARTEGEQLFEWQSRRGDGEVFWSEVALKACEINGQPRVIASVRDISDRKKAEEAQRVYWGYQQAVLDNFPFMVWLKDSESRFLTVNKVMALSCGLESPRDLTGKTDLDIWPKELAEAYRADDRTVLASGEPKNVEELIEPAGEARRYFETYKSPVYVNGCVLGTVGFARDISERKLAEELLAAERERLTVTLKSIGDGVIATDTAGRIVIMNRVAESLTGWTQGEAVGKALDAVFTIVREGTREAGENPVTKILAQKGNVELANHTLLIARDGSERLISESGAPILDTAGKIIGVVLVFRDMTEKQRLIETAQKNQKLESLGVLAGGIAHDFNNLLGGLFGYLDLAHARTKDPQVLGYLNSALGSLERARALTHQLLTFAKGGAPVRKAEPIYPFLKETANFALSGSRVSFALEVEADIWSVEFDKNQLAQVVDNVLINAQQAMPMGGTVRLRASNLVLKAQGDSLLPPGDYVHISISDNGIGIPKDILPRIFDPFFTTKQKGSGLGLATSYSIMRRHNGDIEVESDLGKGSTFHLYLPAQRVHPVVKAEAKPKVLRGTGSILVMDDEEVIRDAVHAMLSMQGYSVTGARDGSEALQAFKQAENGGKPFNMVILDLTVPGGLGGKEVAAEIRTRNAEVPLIVSSGYAEDPVVAAPQAFGFSDSLCKPFTLAELAQVVSKYLG